MNENKTKQQLSKTALEHEILPVSESLYRTIFENTGNAIFVIEEDNTILLANEEFEKLTGYLKNEVEGKKKWTELVARKDDLERMLEYHRLRCIDPQSAPHTYEFQLVDRQGQIKDIVVTVTPMPGSKQTLALLEDITNHKKLEVDLQESKRWLADIIDFLPDATVAIDLSGKVIAWNLAMEEMTGVKAENIVGKGDYEYALPFYGLRRPVLIDLACGLTEKIEIKYDYVRREGDVLLAETEVILRGKLHTAWGKARPLYDCRGNVAGAIESVRDITELKRAETALKESKRRLADIIDFLPDATFAIDLSGKVIAWNRAIEEMTGVKARDMLGKGDHEYAIPFYEMRRPILIDLVFGNDEEIEKKYDFVKREGDVLLTENSVTVGSVPLFLWGKARPLYNSNGDVVGAIESIRDVTELKEAREELQKANDKLELRVQERTEEVVRSRQTTTNILESITDIYMAFDHQWRFLDLNALAEKVIGKTRNEVLGKIFWNLFPQIKKSNYFRQYQKAMASRNPIHFEAKLTNGRWYESHTYPSDNSLSIYSRDITARKEADEALQRGRTLLQSLIDNTPALIYAIDTKGKIIIANKAFG
ncbi:MAG: PAS domain S-box protein, partial [Syntrophorhabdus sp.]